LSAREFAREHSLIAPSDLLSSFLKEYGMESDDDKITMNISPTTIILPGG
jgi:hypothetical protein